jgi:ABC-type transporter Mla subunit MlaD
MPYGELHKTRRNRNLALGAVLLGLALLFFAVTLVKLQGLP